MLIDPGVWPGWPGGDQGGAQLERPSAAALLRTNATNDP